MLPGLTMDYSAGNYEMRFLVDSADGAAAAGHRATAPILALTTRSRLLAGLNTRVRLEGSELSIPVITAPDAVQQADSATAPAAADFQVGGPTLKPRQLEVVSEFSGLARRQMGERQFELIAADLAEKILKKLESIVLTSTADPVGIIQYDNANKVTALDTGAKLAAIEEAVNGLGLGVFEGMTPEHRRAFILSPAAARSLRGMRVGTTSLPVYTGGQVFGEYPVIIAPQLAANDGIFADLQQLALGYFYNDGEMPAITVDQASQAGITRYYALMWADFAVIQNALRTFAVS